MEIKNKIHPVFIILIILVAITPFAALYFHPPWPQQLPKKIIVSCNEETFIEAGAMSEKIRSLENRIIELEFKNEQLWKLYSATAAMAVLREILREELAANAQTITDIDKKTPELKFKDAP